MENMENMVVLTDESGNEVQFEVITVLEIEDNEYYVLYPVESEEDDAIVLKLNVTDDGEEMLVAIEDDEEFEKVAGAYEEWLEDDEEWEEEEKPEQ